MVAKNRSRSRPYPYLIPEIDRKKIGNPRPLERNEFFFIEALLRSKSLIEAYGKGGAAGARALQEKLHAFGIRGQNPLDKTHHSLLVDPSPADNGLDQAWGSLGYIFHKRELYFLDLGIIAHGNPNRSASAGNVDIYDAQDGLARCQAVLKSKDPRYVCLRINLEKPTSEILAALRSLIHERKKLTNALPRHLRPFSKLDDFWERKKKTPFVDIETWLDYFRCYDLSMAGMGSTAIGKAVYGNDLTATTKSSQACRRAKRLISIAEQGIRDWPPKDFQ